MDEMCDVDVAAAGAVAQVACGFGGVSVSPLR
jgi:hypothetical protein